MIEMLMVFVMFGVVVAVGVRAMGETLQHDRPAKAANVFAADIETAFSLAARQRLPIKVHLDSAKRVYHIEDRTDTLMKFKVRDLSTGDREVGFMRFSPDTFFVMPNGIATSTLTARFGYVGVKGTVTHIVQVSRTGMVTVDGR
jgi:type II secretory pathway pseudopilin PulG